MNILDHGRAKGRGVQLCSAAKNAIEIAGQVFVPDAATAYVEFFLSHAFPVFLDNFAPGEEPDKTCIHPQTLANSYRSLQGKVLNLAHLMRSYDPKKNPRDRILGTVMAVEFPPQPSGGWTVQGNPAQAPGIRAVAALHKNAEGVMNVISTWNDGKTPFGDTEWTVSMENESNVDEGGFLVKTGADGIPSVLLEFAAATPEDFKALGWTFVPYLTAPPDLKACLKTGGYVGMEKDYQGCDTLFMNGGLSGTIFYYGVALTPAGKESAARVGRIEASLPVAPDAAVAALCRAVSEFADGVRATGEGQQK